jgi:hypothetical protein
MLEKVRDSSYCHKSMGWVTMQMELRLFFLFLTLSNILNCPLLPGLSRCVIIFLGYMCSYHYYGLMLWTATTYWFALHGKAWDSPDLHIQLCLLHLHFCTSPYGLAPLRLKHLLLLPHYYTTLTPPQL